MIFLNDYQFHSNINFFNNCFQKLVAMETEEALAELGVERDVHEVRFSCTIDVHKETLEQLVSAASATLPARAALLKCIENVSRRCTQRRFAS